MVFEYLDHLPMVGLIQQSSTVNRSIWRIGSELCKTLSGICICKLVPMHFAAVVSFAAGLLLGGCIVIFGFRGSLFRRDTLLRQSSPERPTLSAPNTPGARPAATSRPSRPSRPSHDPPVSRGSHPPSPPIASPSPQSRQDPSGLRSCKDRSCLGRCGERVWLDSSLGEGREIIELFSIFNFRTRHVCTLLYTLLFNTFLFGLQSYPFLVAIGETYWHLWFYILLTSCLYFLRCLLFHAVSCLFGRCLHYWAPWKMGKMKITISWSYLTVLYLRIHKDRFIVMATKTNFCQQKSLLLARY